MRTALALAVALATLLALSGCDELLRPGFPHRAHLTTDKCGGEGQPDCPTCASCHGTIRQDDGTVDGVGLPSKKVCRDCHEANTDEVMKRVRPSPERSARIVFSHQGHLDQPEIAGQCVRCHSGVADDGTKGKTYPDMAECLQCHNDQFQRGICTNCHERGSMRTLVPQTFLRHDTAWLRDHGISATTNEKVCNQCHAQSDCARCHDQGQPLGLAQVTFDEPFRKRIHRADFVSRHAMEASSQRGQCVRCHTVSFCDSCHVARGISGNRLSSPNPHPLGWIGPDPSSPNFHGRQARRDILSCAGCHDAGPATNCIRCHKVGAYGGNPHPGGWRSARSPDAAMCQYCHVP